MDFKRSPVDESIRRDVDRSSVVVASLLSEYVSKELGIRCSPAQDPPFQSFPPQFDVVFIACVYISDVDMISFQKTPTNPTQRLFDFQIDNERMYIPSSSSKNDTTSVVCMCMYPLNNQSNNQNPSPNSRITSFFLENSINPSTRKSFSINKEPNRSCDDYIPSFTFFLSFFLRIPTSTSTPQSLYP
jgi:hypothetical protein